jgi:hypothetical protein
MKIDKLSVIKKSLEEELKTTQQALNSAVEARDSAPSAMESHTDTTRNQSEKMVTALTSQLTNLKKMIESLPETIPVSQNRIDVWSLVELIGSIRLSVILVPEGYGGKECDGVKIVSVEAPLGRSLLGKKIGNNISILDNKFIISAVA